MMSTKRHSEYTFSSRICSFLKILMKRSPWEQMRLLACFFSKLKGLKILIAALVLLLASALQGHSFDRSATNVNRTWNLIAEQKPNHAIVNEHFLKASDLSDWVARLRQRNGLKQAHLYPAPPKLTENFSWKGRYLVPDLVDPETGKLGIDVPFTWFAKDGNIQMIAGSERDPIYFTNLIYDDHLYTYPYKWPGLQEEFLPPLEPCGPLFEFSLDDLNAFLSTSQYVGAEILEINPCQRAHVHHFRVGIVLPHAPPGFYIRFPILSADIYVDQKDSSKIWKVLHFGLQNIYDPDLDEWIVINNFDQCSKEPKLPAACSG